MSNTALLANWGAPESAEPATPKEAAATGVRTTIVRILGLLPTLRVAHWQASTKTNEHKALGDFYEALDGLVDDFTETLMGLEGDRSLPAQKTSIETDNAFIGVVKELRSLINTLVGDTSGEADLNNIAADMRQAVNKVCYLLEIGKD